MKCELEICAYSLESCLAAKKAGATRIELCAGIYEGGTTPSLGMVKLARKLTAGVQLYIMIRPRGGDFLYSDIEFEQMREDILSVKTLGVEGVVLGILKRDGSIDIERTRELVRLAAPLKVTFHRAFDMVKDPEKALEAVIQAGCFRILTSGFRNTVEEGIDGVKKIVKQAGGRIQIMAGSGVNAGNVLKIAETGVDAVHLSAKNGRESDMQYRNPAIFMGGISGISEYQITYCDEDKVKEVRNILQNKTMAHE